MKHAAELLTTTVAKSINSHISRWIPPWHSRRRSSLASVAPIGASASVEPVTIGWRSATV